MPKGLHVCMNYELNQLYHAVKTNGGDKDGGGARSGRQYPSDPNGPSGKKTEVEYRQ